MTMFGTYKIEETFLCVVVIVLAQLLTRCAVLKYKGEESFHEDQIKMILPGKSTKQEILLWFGPPLAIARKGKVMKLPPPAGGEEHPDEVRWETFLRLFSPKHELTSFHSIYYYHYAESETEPVYFVYADRAEKKLVIDKLWILINQQTGIVEDYIFRRQR